MISKNRKIIFLTIILGFAILVIGASYSYFTARAISDVQSVKNGSLEITYENTLNINAANMVPTTEENASIHQFTITNTGTLDTNYNISMINISLQKNGGNITSSNLMWALYNASSDYSEGDLIRKGSFSQTSGYLAGNSEYVIVTDLPLSVNESKSYLLKIWLQEAGELQNEDQGLSLSFNVEVDTSAKVASGGEDLPQVMSRILERDSSSSTENYYAYSDSIEKIIIQNSLTPIVEANESWDVSVDNNGSVMAYLVSDTNTLYLQGDKKIYLPEEADSMFRGFSNLTTIEGLEYLDVSETKSFYSMFKENPMLTSLEFTNWNSSQAVTMESMFDYCTALESIVFTNFDTSTVENMKRMFAHCEALTSLDLSVFVTSNVTQMESMFYYCSSLIDLDTSNFDTSKVTTMEQMFRYCVFTELDLRHFDVSSVTNMTSLFNDCQSLVNLDLTGWTNSALLTGDRMFEDCFVLSSVSLTNFSFQNVTTLDNLFRNCESLVSIDLRQADFSDLLPTDMFYDIPDGVTIYVKDVVMQNHILSLYSTGNVVVYTG